MKFYLLQRNYQKNEKYSGKKIKNLYLEMKLKKESDGNLKHYPTSIGKKDRG